MSDRSRQHLIQLPATSLHLQQGRERLADALLQELQQDTKAFAAPKAAREASPPQQQQQQQEQQQYDLPRVRIYSNTFRAAGLPAAASSAQRSDLQGPLVRGSRQPRDCSWQATPGAAKQICRTTTALEPQPVLTSETSRESGSSAAEQELAEASPAQPGNKLRPISESVKLLVAQAAGGQHLDAKTVRQLAQEVPDIRNKLLHMTRMLRMCHAEVQRRLLKTKAQQQASPHPPTAASPSDSTKCAPAGGGHQQQQGLDSCTVSTRVSQHLVPGPMQASHGAARIPTPGQGRHFVLSVLAPFSQRVRVGQKPPIVTPMEPPADPLEPRELPAHVPPPLSDMTPRLRDAPFYSKDSDDLQLQPEHLIPAPSKASGPRVVSRTADADQPIAASHGHKLEDMPSSSSPVSSATAAAEFPSLPSQPHLSGSLAVAAATDGWQDDNEAAAQTLLELCNVTGKLAAKPSAKAHQRLSMVDAVVSAHFSMASSSSRLATSNTPTKKRPVDDKAGIFSFKVPKRQRTNAAHASPSHSSEGSGTSEHATAAKMHNC